MSKKNLNEVRDPVHAFVLFDKLERDLINSSPVQRLKHIHQLSMTYQVYPGATHKRFEHSLGVMELAGRVFDVVTKEKNFRGHIRDYLSKKPKFDYWRKVLRIAALLHDVGHLPFSHSAEKELLRKGWDHERMTMELILKSEISEILRKSRPRVEEYHVVKLALGPKYEYIDPRLKMNWWERILADIITSDTFGVDRMDYLLRDSLYAGVAYGRVDHFRLIDTLRILEPPLDPKVRGKKLEPILGVSLGGLHCAESLLLARYFMFQQVYFHPVRRAYDYHLKEFLKAWLKGRKFSTGWKRYLKYTDYEIISEIRKAAKNRRHRAHEHANRIERREHFRKVYSPSALDRKKNSDALDIVARALGDKFGEENIYKDIYTKTQSEGLNFPIELDDGRVVDSLSESDVLNSIPATSCAFVFANPEISDKMKSFLKKNLDRILGRNG